MNSVILINPPLTLEDRYGKDMKRFGAVSEPLGLAFIAGYLEHLKIPVRILDSQAEIMSIADVVTAISSGDEKLIGITMLTPAFGVVKALCRQIKIHCPDRTIVLGGAHCTVLPERTLNEIPDADIVCIGEGEVTFSEIAQMKDLSLLFGIIGICFRADDTLIKTGERQSVHDLDRIPPPARHLLPMGKSHLMASRVSGSAYCQQFWLPRVPIFLHINSMTFERTFPAPTTSAESYQIFIDGYIQISQLNIEADTSVLENKYFFPNSEEHG